MTEPTLDAVRAWLHDRAEWYERREKYGERHATESDAWDAALHRFALAALDDAERWRKAAPLMRALIPTVTIRQVFDAGEDAIEAFGLNPWCMNEGLATGDETVDVPWWMDDAR